MRRRSITFALMLAGLTSSCSGTMVMVPRMQPAEVNLAGYKRIAIGGVGGAGGEALVTDLTQALVESQRFDVLDRQHLQQVMKEQDFNASGRVSDDSAVSIGQLIGSSTLLVGDISAYDYNERMLQEERTCLKKGKQLPCVEYSRQATAEVRVAFKVLDTETGKVLAAKSLEARRVLTSPSTINDEPAALMASDSMLAECRREVATAFVNVIAPHQVTLGVELLADGDLPELEIGNNYARLGKWAEAIAQYAKAIGRAEQDPDIDNDVAAKAHYDLGVAYGYSGRYEAGITALEHSFALDPSDRTLAQIGAIKQFKLDDQRLAEQRAGAAEDTH
jgi:curli biogenesis system outer membrane secretion channel CsgG